MSFSLPGATSGQVKAAVTATVAASFGIPEGSVQLTVTESRRRLQDQDSLVEKLSSIRGQARRLAGTWNVKYALIVETWKAAEVQNTAKSIGNNTAAFSSTLSTALESVGVQASSLQIASFSPPTVTKLSESSITTTRTTTTTTFTTTTTTTTSPVPLELLGARLTRHFSDLELTFNVPVRLASEGLEASQIVSCADAFAPQAVATLGSLPLCVFSADRRTLRATLGSGPTITLNSTISTKDGVLLHRDFGGWPPLPSLNATVTTLDDVVPVQAVVVAMPPMTQACGKVSFSASQSTGSAGRALSARWRFGPSTPTPMRPFLQATLDAANAVDASLLQISAEDFSAAVGALKVILGAAYYRMEVVVEVEATVTNWLGASDSSSATVIVIKEQEPLPQISPLGPTTLEANRTDVVSFAVETSTLPPDTRCSGSTTTASTRRVVVVTWEYRVAGASGWSSLDGTGGIVDVARPPNVVRFNPNTFAPLSQVSFRATAAYPDTSAGAIKPYVEFSLTIGPNPPPIADIFGPQETNTLCEFVLDATGSTDLAATGAPALNAEWSCAPAAPGGPSCAGLVNFGFGNFARTDGAGARGMLLRVAGGQLQEGSYVFSVAVRRASEANGPVDTASMVVQVRAGAPPPMTLSTPWDKSPYVSLSPQGLTGPVVARSTGSAACPIPTSWAWQWVLVREDTTTPTLAGFLGTATKKVPLGGSNISSSEVEVTTSDWRTSLLEPGRMYSYALLRAESAVLIEGVQSDGLSTVDAVQAIGVAVMRSETFTAVGVPSSGIVSVTPLQGEAIKTEFTVSTSGWFTQDSSLSYAFYQFPLPAGPTLYEDAGRLKATPEFVPPEIEWDNKTSSNYWRNLGGKSLRAWGTSNALSGVVLPVGKYYIVARALDGLGGTGFSMALGPIVAEPSGGVTQVAMQAALDSVQASNDPDKILNAVETITVATGSSSDASVKDTVMSQAVGALENVVRYVEPDTFGVDKMSQAVTNVLKETNAAEILTRASNVLDRTLDAALQGAEGGVTQQAGESVMETISAISGGASARIEGASGQQAVGGISSSALAKAEAKAVQQKVQQLTNKLATAAMNKLQVGQSQTLNAVDSDGKGAKMAVDKVSMQDSVQAGVEVQGLKLQPGSLKANARRLSSCGSLGVQQTDWLRSNPYSWVQTGIGYNDFIAINADVKLVDLNQCGSPVTLDSNAPPMQIIMGVPPVGMPPAGYRWELTCGVFNQSIQAWDSYGMQLEENATTSGPTVTCLSSLGTGAYTSFWLPVQLPSTSTTSTTTTFTSTNTTTSTAPTPAPTPEPEPELNVALVASLSAAAFVCLLVCCLIVCFVRKRRNDARKVEPSSEIAQVPGDVPPQDPRRFEVEADAHFWEWARDWAGSRRPPPFGDSNLGLARIPDPPPLAPLVERPPVSPAGMPALPPIEASAPGRAEAEEEVQGVQVVVDANFWDWAREWAQLRAVASNDVTPHARPALPVPGPRVPQPPPVNQQRRPSMERFGLVDGPARQPGGPLPALRRNSNSKEPNRSKESNRHPEAWGSPTPPPTLPSEHSVEIIDAGRQLRQAGAASSSHRPDSRGAQLQ